MAKDPSLQLSDLLGVVSDPAKAREFLDEMRALKVEHDQAAAAARSAAGEADRRINEANQRQTAAIDRENALEKREKAVAEKEEQAAKCEQNWQAAHAGKRQALADERERQANAVSQQLAELAVARTGLDNRAVTQLRRENLLAEREAAVKGREKRCADAEAQIAALRAAVEAFVEQKHV